MIIKSYYIIQKFLLIIITSYFFYIYYSNYQRTNHLLNNSIIEKPIQRLLNSTLIHIHGSIKHLGPAKQIYIINLPHRQDRRTGSIGLFQKLQFDAFIVPGYTVHSPEVISRIHLTKTNPIRLCEIACWASHTQLWLEVATLPNDTWIFIFEDDIDLELSTFDILQSFPLDLWIKPDMIYLGYCGNAPGQLIFKGIENYRIHQALHPGCTHAYGIRSYSAKKLLQFLSSPHKPIDDTIIDLVNEKKLLIYSIHPPLALQQLNTSVQPAEITPQRSQLMFKIKTWTNYIFDRWTGAEFGNKLKNSTLTKVNLKEADQWRKIYENKIWKNNLTLNYSLLFI